MPRVNMWEAMPPSSEEDERGEKDGGRDERPDDVAAKEHNEHLSFF